jgi:serine/threonine-protein kinase
MPAIQGADRDIAVAPDGSFFVYRAGSQAQLAIRRVDQLDAVPVGGVTNARGPFISPDGKWIGFVENNTNLKKVAVAGGSPITLAVLPGSPRGAAWVDDATIVVATNATGLLRVPASGGEPTVLTTPDRAQGELGHLHPSALPGGRSLLFTIATRQPANAEVAVVDLETRRVSRLLRGGSDARYVSSGHLLYESGGGTLSAVTFDPDRVVVTGDSVPVIEKVAVSNTGSLNAAVSGSGMLIYLRGGLGDARPRSLSWIDRQGRETVFPAPERAYASLRLSPEGTVVALEVRDPTPNIWLWDLARQTLMPLTFNGGMAPVWTPDGHRVVFASAGVESPNLYARAADGTGTDTRLTTSANVQVPTSVTPDGRFVISVERRQQTASDLVQVTLNRTAADQTAMAGVIETSFTEQNGEVSPDGRFLAYESNEAGRFEVFVQPYPESRGKWRVSSGGGTRPVWTRNGRELVYLDAANHLTIVPLETTGSTLRAGRATTLAATAYAATNIAWRTFDVSPDGQRFLVIKEPASTAQDQNFVVVLNFLEELKQKIH